MNRGRCGCRYCNPGCDAPYTHCADPTGCRSCRASEWALYPWPELTHPEWAALRAQLDLRAGGRCEGCGLPFVPGIREPNAHHRRSRGKGGTDDHAINGLANLLLLCAGRSARLGGAGDGCHARVNDPANASRGLTVQWGAYTGAATGPPPEVATPLVLASGRRVLLAVDAAVYLRATGAPYAA